MDMDEIASVVRALEPEFADDRGRLKRLEGALDELGGWAEHTARFIGELDGRVEGIEAHIATPRPGTDMTPAPTPVPLSPEGCMAALQEYGVGVADYAKFLRELKDRDADGEVDG
jgi:hypothetical protein